MSKNGVTYLSDSLAIIVPDPHHKLSDADEAWLREAEKRLEKIGPVFTIKYKKIKKGNP